MSFLTSAHCLHFARKEGGEGKFGAGGGERKGDLGRTGAVDVQKGLTENWVGGLEG